MITYYLSMAIRVVVFGLFAVAAVVAGAHWLVQNGKLQPFGAFPRFARRLGEPFVRPIERRALRSGGNPSKAPYYFFWAAVLGGLALIGIVNWVIGIFYTLTASAAAGPAGLAFFLVNGIFSLIMLALFVRIIASWLSISPYSKPMRVVYGLTDWIIEPLRRVLPTFGPFDLSPMVAYLMLMLARSFVLGLL
jgi:YggT family protein